MRRVALRLKRVYDAIEPDDGIRVLVTYYWPRGIPKTSVDRWYRALGTPPALLKPWQQGKVPRDRFVSLYRTAVETEEARGLIRELAALAREQTVTLLTSFRDLEHSHLPILRQLIEEEASRLAPKPPS
ncbi:MAG: DUF488 family protein [Limnochordaceae bacterium]|nr:DUF488 family protein [Limnochordaceae bacterium]